MEHQIQSILDDVLGIRKDMGRGEQYYSCPFCSHHNPKFAVNIQKGAWHCWHCNKAGRSFVGLLRRIGAPKNKIHEMAALVKEYIPKIQFISLPTGPVSLPSEFLPLWKPRKTHEYRNALKYVVGRGLTAQDLLRYQIGYCEEGKYRGRIIIPNFDEFGVLNFFTGRSYYADVYMPHLNPKISKNIVGFERDINWDLPIVLCEGAYDAIAIKRNAIPLYGKIPSARLQEKILEEGVKEIYLALDTDALKQITTIAEKFMKENITVYRVELPGKDPSDIGFAEMTKLIKNAKPLTFSSLVALKMVGV
jgi:DNA primase